MATTRSRPRGREIARQNAGGVVADHVAKIYGIAIAGIVVIVAFLVLTRPGHVVAAASQNFLLPYAGVIALLALCGAVGFGLIATDRMVLNPGHRIFVQSLHRAASFGALAFLIIHVITEILAQRSSVIDGFIPFLSPFRPLYVGMGTIAGDLIILLVITSIFRRRFITNGKTWMWRAIHYSAYVSFILGILHGLLAGRAAKPYYSWAYGVFIALVAIMVAVRIIGNSLRPKENLSAPAVAETAVSASAPMRAASMVAQLGAVRSMASGSMAALTPSSGPMRVMGASGPMPAVAALPAPVAEDRQPVYEPGYEGPARFAGAPSREATAATGSMSAAGGPAPRAVAGAMPPAGAGMMAGPAGGPMPRGGTGPAPMMPRPQVGPGRSPMTGPLPSAEGPMPGGRPAPTSQMPRMGTGPRPAMPPQPPTGGRMRNPMPPPPSPRQMPPIPSGPMPVQPMPGPGGRAPRGPVGALPPGGTGPRPQQGGGTPYGGRPPAGQPGPSGQPGGQAWNGDRDPGWGGGDPGWGGPGGYGPGDGYNSGGYAPDAGYPSGGYPSGGYAPDAGYPSGGYPSGGYPSGGYPSGGYATGGYGPDGGAPVNDPRQGYGAPQGYPEPEPAGPGYDYGYDNYGGSPYGRDNRR